DGTTDVWDFEQLEPIGATCRHQDSVWSLALSPDDRTIAVGGGFGAIRLWNIALPGSLCQILKNDDPIDVIAVSPDGHVAATAGHNGIVRRWDLCDGSPAGTPWRHPADVVGLVFDYSGTHLLSACEDGTARCLDLATEPGG